MHLIGKSDGEDQPSDWYCPSCTVEFRRMKAARPGDGPPMHRCRSQRNLLIPMVPKGIAAKHVLREREDFVDGEQVQLDGEGRPTMSVETWRDDGQDVIVYAPAATGEGESHGTASNG